MALPVYILLFSISLSTTAAARAVDVQRLTFFMQDISNVHATREGRTTWQPFARHHGAHEADGIGVVSGIEGRVRDGCSMRSPTVGKVKGAAVTTKTGSIGEEIMIAMTVDFGENGEEDVVRLFGVFDSREEESNLVLIGGSGGYEEARGYAVVRSFRKESQKCLKFTVHFLI